MANANRESLGFIAEVTKGTNPGGTKQLLNFVSQNLSKQNTSQVSKNVRSDRNKSGVVRTAVEVGGDIAVELSYGAYDSLIESALGGTFSTALSIVASTGVSAASSDNSFNGTGLFSNAVVGQWVKVSGFANAGNNGYFKVATAASGKITVVGGTLTTESAGPAVTIKGSLCKNGTTEKTFTIERHFTEITSPAIYNLFTGLIVDEMSFNLATSDIAQGSFSLIGLDMAVGSSSGFSGSTAAATTASMNSVENIKKVFVNNIVSTEDYTGIEFSVNNNVNARRAMGSLAAVDVTQKSIDVTGTISEYFENVTMLNRLVNFNDVALAVVIEDAAGNGYVFDFPSCKITQAALDNGGTDSDINLGSQFTAFYNSVYGCTIGVSRFPA